VVVFKNSVVVSQETLHAEKCIQCVYNVYSVYTVCTVQPFIFDYRRNCCLLCDTYSAHNYTCLAKYGMF
jgi:hypothetical protein